MLLTYDQSKEIPNKRSIFYKRAYEVLYERHDGSKGIFRRDHHAGLPLDEFERVFSSFCFGTYVNGVIDFSESSLVRFFRAAAELSDISQSPSSIAKDAYESVCLLVKEGHDFTFCHRSFQEYFVAVFLRDYRGDDIQDLYNLALRSSQGESVLEFIYEMDQISLERNYIMPKLKKIISSIKRSIENDEDGFGILKYFLKEIVLVRGSLGFAGWTMERLEQATFVFSLSHLYEHPDFMRSVLDFSNDKINYRNFSLDRARRTRSYKETIQKDTGKELAVLKFSPSAKIWLESSEIHEKSVVFWKELNNLYQALIKKHSESNSDMKTKFKEFSAI